MHSQLGNQLITDFGDDGYVPLVHSFASAALGMMGSGWIWLAADAQCNLGLVGTYGPGTLLVSNQTRRGEYLDLLTEHSSPKQDSAFKKESGEQAAKRNFSTSASTRAVMTSTSTPPSIAYQSAPRFEQQRDVRSELYPLLCLSIHEHAWLEEYGIWGKEAYVTNFWNAVDWPKVQRDFDHLWAYKDSFRPSSY